MEMQVYNQQGEAAGKVKLSDSVFGVAMNADLLYQVITALTSNKRQVIAHAKGRSEVRGGGKKPWQQKGTGRARHGSIRSPIWKGGGVTHGPTKERNFKKKINQKAAKKALSVALSAKTREGQLVVLDNIALTAPKTKEMAAVVRKISGILPGYTVSKTKSSTILVVVPAARGPIQKASQNIPFVNVIEARNLNPLAVLSSKYLVLLKDAVEGVEKRFQSK